MINPARNDENAPEETPEQYARAQGLGHALRTPLNQILGYSELLADELHSRSLDELLPDVHRIERAGRDLLGIVEEHGAELSRLDATRSAPYELDEAAIEPDALGYLEQFKPAEQLEQGRLLVVDDLEANREVLQRVLEKRGYTVTSAASGTEALRLVEEQPFDLMLLDILMPDVSGWEVLQRVRQNKSLSNLPVVMISAIDEHDAVVRCLELGADDYIVKPFEPSILKARIGARLEAKRAVEREAKLYSELADHYQALQRLEAERDDLTHMIVHDLRTPLTSVIAALHSVEGTTQTDPQTAECLEIATYSSNNLLRMINNLLDMSKLEAGSMQAQPDQLDVSAFVDRSIKDVEFLARDKRITLERDLTGGPSFLGDEELLHRVLVNLLGNALKFTPDGGTVRVKADVGPDRFEMSVADSGIGIPDDMKERIFDKFAQVASTRADRKMSTGLGLTFCRLAVEGHGGKIWVEDNPAGGAIFKVEFPQPPKGA